MRYEAEQRAKYEAALSRLPPRLGLVLDAGCGTGLLFGHIEDLAETIVGLDISGRALMLSKSRASGFKNVHLMVADADHMPFPHEVFNSVFAITLIQNSPDPSDTITELVRVAKSDAAIVVTGLKRIFSLDEFEKLLRKAKLKIVIIEDEALQCYVAVCARYPSKSHKA